MEARDRLLTEVEHQRNILLLANVESKKQIIADYTAVLSDNKELIDQVAAGKAKIQMLESRLEIQEEQVDQDFLNQLTDFMKTRDIQIKSL